MQVFRLPARAFKPVVSSVLAVLLAGCAATTSFDIREDSRDWARQNIQPIIDTQPEKALARVEDRMRSMCPLPEGKLGTDSFSNLLQGTAYADNDDACEDLAILANYLYYKLGTQAAHVPMLDQVFFERARILHYKGWSAYGQLDCSVFYGNYDVYYPLGFEFKEREALGGRYDLPVWYDMQVAASPKEAERGNFLYKHYLCRLGEHHDAQRESELKAAFVADVLRLFGRPAADSVQQYLDKIHTPLKQTNQALIARYSTDGLAWHVAQKVVLYENAMLRLSELGLDKVTHNDDQVFRNHLQQVLDSDRATLKRAVTAR